jgi:hypothetical protein
VVVIGEKQGSATVTYWSGERGGDGRTRCKYRGPFIAMLHEAKQACAGVSAQGVTG